MEPTALSVAQVGMGKSLDGKRIAFLAADGFEQPELAEPRQILEKDGAQTELVSPCEEEAKAWSQGDWDGSVPVDRPLAQANGDLYDALVIPGGALHIDSLRANEAAIEFVRTFFEAGKPVGAIGHAPALLIDADETQERTLTSRPSIRRDLINADAEWIDEPVVVDHGLVTSRGIDDLEAFSQKLVEEIGEGIHMEQAVKSGASLD